MELASPHRNGFSRRAESVDDRIVRQVLMLCAVTIVAGNVACSGGKLASLTDGSTDRRDASGDVAMDAGPRDLPPESRDAQDARDAPGDTRDGAAETPAPDTNTDGAADAADVRVDAGDGSGDMARADRPPDAIVDGAGDAAVGVDATSDAIIDGDDAADAGDDGPASDAPVEAGRPFIQRDCSRADGCVCASNESCEFTCPGGDCAVTCAAGSSCTVSCLAPYGCSVSCGSDATCILGCFLGVCAHWFGPASTLACDSAGTGCI